MLHRRWSLPCVWQKFQLSDLFMELGGLCAQVGWWVAPISNTVASAITIGTTAIAVAIAVATHVAAATIATAAVDVAALLVATSSTGCRLLV